MARNVQFGPENVQIEEQRAPVRFLRFAERLLRSKKQIKKNLFVSLGSFLTFGSLSNLSCLDV